MSSKIYTIADLTRGGLFVRRVTCGADQLRYNVAEHEVAIEGRHDPLSQRMDPETRNVVDYQPPQPDADHEWNAQTKRWQKNAAAIQRDIVQRRIIELERQQTPRMLREAALGDAQAVARLRAVDQEIAALRPDLQRPEPSQSPE